MVELTRVRNTPRARGGRVTGQIPMRKNKRTHTHTHTQQAHHDGERYSSKFVSSLAWNGGEKKDERVLTKFVVQFDWLSSLKLNIFLPDITRHRVLGQII